MNEVWVLVSDMFMELLSVEIITRHKKEKLHFYNEKSERISIDEVKGRLAERIKETRVPYYGTEYSSVYRCEKGRFISGNHSAKKSVEITEDVYLYYLISGSMEELAHILGVSRQTISKYIRQYEQENGLATEK